MVEPGDLWQRWLPARYADRAPKLTSVRGRLRFDGRANRVVEDPDSPWISTWVYCDLVQPLITGFAAIGIDVKARDHGALHYDDIPAGCYERAARLVAMNQNHTEASQCFPTMPRFCGQTFLERGDRDVSLACVRAYNDWMIDEWCSAEARGRLIPLTLMRLSGSTTCGTNP